MRVNYKVNVLIIILSSLFLLTSCISGKPSEEDERQVIENLEKRKNDEAGGNAFKLLSIKRLSSQSETSIHNAEYQITNECLRELFLVCSEGQVIERKYHLRFEKTAKGWEGPDGNFY